MTPKAKGDFCHKKDEKCSHVLLMFSTIRNISWKKKKGKVKFHNISFYYNRKLYLNYVLVCQLICNLSKL